VLTPDEIVMQQFKTAFRGYDQQEVGNFQTVVAKELQHLHDQINLLKNKLHKQEEHLNTFRDKEETLNNALLSSQRYTDQMNNEAEKSAREIIQNAQTKGRKIVQKEQKEVEKLQKQQETLRQENKQFMQRIRYILKEHEELLTTFEEENVAARAGK